MVKVQIVVREQRSRGLISGAPVYVGRDDSPPRGKTDAQGILLLELPEGSYIFRTVFLGQWGELSVQISGTQQTVTLGPALDLAITTKTGDCSTEILFANQGDVVCLTVSESRLFHGASEHNFVYDWNVTAGSLLETDQPPGPDAHWHTFNAAGKQTIRVKVTAVDLGVAVTAEKSFTVLQVPGYQSAGAVPVSLRRTEVAPTRDQALWVAIRNRTKAISFSGSGYEDFINRVLCQESNLITGPNGAALRRQHNELYEPIHGVGAYELLKTATQVFLLLECGPAIEEADRYTGDTLYDPEEETSRLGRAMPLNEVRNRLQEYLGDGTLPYISRVLETAFQGRSLTDSIFCAGVLRTRTTCPPMLELIWSYWHEEAMLVQTMNALSLRFQNRRSKADRDPLAHVEIAPLYPANNLLWGYIQGEMHHLSVARRNYEYNHHYGLKLYGDAVSEFRPADPRSRFLEGFHNLLYLTTHFFKQADDTTVIPDGFPILNALREVHLVLSEGAHNQFGDLPWMARAEMLTQQWLLSRPEVRDFLQSRAMVPYRESWMPQVDTMKQLQGWTDVSVTHFNFLAVYGEQLLLSIRYGDWVGLTDPVQAANWARYWRPEIQGYIHAYRTVTGVDLAADARDSQQAELRVMQPSELLRRRLAGGATPALMPPASTVPQNFQARRAERRLATSQTSASEV